MIYNRLHGSFHPSSAFLEEIMEDILSQHERMVVNVDVGKVVYSQGTEGGTWQMKVRFFGPMVMFMQSVLQSQGSDIVTNLAIKVLKKFNDVVRALTGVKTSLRNPVYYPLKLNQRPGNPVLGELPHPSFFLTYRCETEPWAVDATHRAAQLQQP